MLLLRSIEKNELNTTQEQQNRFPYTVPFVQQFTRIDFASEVTFLVGENGSGKSTFLEMLACAIDAITVGSQAVSQDETLAAVRAYASSLKLVWSKRTKNGFFMRSEDFFGYVKQMGQMRAELEAEIKQVDKDYQGRSDHAKSLAKMPYQSELHAMNAAYGDDGLDANSHGEAFFKLFRERFRGEGVYLLDEPEAPLSPNRQLTLLSMIKMLVDAGGQFIIATHSPILMAYPGATILSFDEGAVQAVNYESLEHVTVTRSFLNDPESYLRYLMGDA